MKIYLEKQLKMGGLHRLFPLTKGENDSGLQYNKSLVFKNAITPLSKAASRKQEI
jgi:hypothetical protein